VLITYYQE